MIEKQKERRQDKESEVTCGVENRKEEMQVDIYSSTT